MKAPKKRGRESLPSKPVPVPLPAQRRWFGDRLTLSLTRKDWLLVRDAVDDSVDHLPQEIAAIQRKLYALTGETVALAIAERR